MNNKLECEYLNVNLISLLVIFILLSIVLSFIKAPYGRFLYITKTNNSYFNLILKPFNNPSFRIRGNISWCIQECPSFFIPLLKLYANFETMKTEEKIILLSFIIHYFNRLYSNIQLKILIFQSYLLLYYSILEDKKPN